MRGLPEHSQGPKHSQGKVLEMAFDLVLEHEQFSGVNGGEEVSGKRSRKILEGRETVVLEFPQLTPGSLPQQDHRHSR